jgi:hypothetical protein
MPRRLRQPLTVACAIPSSPATNRAPSPRARAPRTHHHAHRSPGPARLPAPPRRSIARPRARDTLSLAGRPIARHPAPHRRHAHTAIARRLAARHLHATTPAATHACSTSGLRPPELWIRETTQSFRLITASTRPRSERPEARQVGSPPFAARRRRWKVAHQVGGSGRPGTRGAPQDGGSWRSRRGAIRDGRTCARRSGRQRASILTRSQGFPDFVPLCGPISGHPSPFRALLALRRDCVSNAAFGGCSRGVPREGCL